MTDYMLLLLWDEKDGENGSPEEIQEITEAHGRFVGQAAAAGVLVSGERLGLDHTASRLQVRDGERLLTDGPFAETKEAIGGFYILRCKSKEDALDWAARTPTAAYGTVEVRPVVPSDQGADQ